MSKKLFNLLVATIIFAIPIVCGFQDPVVQNGPVDTPPPPTLAPDNQITDLDCVYAMKILNCTEILQCPQEWLHPSCLNRTISKEYFDSITLPPPPTTTN